MAEQTPDTFDIENYRINHPEADGYSVRLMVADGLYSEHKNASAALRKTDIRHVVIDAPQWKTSNHGYNTRDHVILDRDDALRFAASTRSDLGRLAKEALSLETPMVDEQPGYTVLNWSELVRWYPEAYGVSLRALVEIGQVYYEYRNAARALEGGDYESLVRVTGDRSDIVQDIVFTNLKDAQLFCVRARNDAGAAIAEVILEHHNEFQKLLEGSDEEAREVVEKVVEHRESKPTQDALVPVTDPSTALIAQMYNDYKELANRTIGALEERNDRLTTMLDSYKAIYPNQKRPDEMTGQEIAASMGWMSSGNHPHSEAVNAAFRMLGAEEGEHYRIIWQRSENSTRGNGIYPVKVYPKVVARRLCQQVYDLVNPDGVDEFSFKPPGGRKCNVYLTGEKWIPKKLRDKRMN
jgi:rubrerythrin